MTKEQAIEYLKADIKHWQNTSVSTEHLEMAIKSLEQQPCEDAISRQAVIDLINADWKYEGLELSINELPPVTPAHCIAAVRFSKEDLREICNERIEVECTHGTCKDCKRSHELSGGSIVCDKLSCIDVEKDFYCKDFEKRGGENDSN